MCSVLERLVAWKSAQGLEQPSGGNLIAIVYWGYIGIMENEREATVGYWGCIGIMENKMEATVVYCCYLGRMEN